MKGKLQYFTCGKGWHMGNRIHRRNHYLAVLLFIIPAVFINVSGKNINQYVKAASDYFSMVETSITIMVGETDFIETDMAADIPYSEADLTWKSDNSSIASVDNTGVITGIAEGSTTVTASMPDGSSEICTIIVSGYINDEDDPDKNIDETEEGDQDNYSENPPFSKLVIEKR